MRKKIAMTTLANLSPFVGFAGSLAGMSFTWTILAKQSTPTHGELMKGVGLALITTLALTVFILVPLAAWARKR
jgi:biopolymer transport protein ExbB/TolQ